MKITLRNFVQNVLEIVMFIYDKKDKWIIKVNNGMVTVRATTMKCQAKGVAFLKQS